MTIQPALYGKVLDDRSVESAIRTTAELGYPGFDIMARAPHVPPDSDSDHIATIERTLSECDLGVPCVTTYTGGYVDQTEDECNAELEALEKYLRFADELGCDLLRHGPTGPPPYKATAADFEKAANWMRKAADLAAEYDKRLGIEIHVGHICETTESTLDLLERIDRPNVGAIHDAGNLFIADAPYGADSIEALGDRLFHVHMKDAKRVPDSEQGQVIETRAGERTFRPTLLGEGAVDYDRVVDALVDVGYTGYITAERTPFDGMSGEEVARHELIAINQLFERHCPEEASR